MHVIFFATLSPGSAAVLEILAIGLVEDVRRFPLLSPPREDRMDAALRFAFQKKPFDSTNFFEDG